jgi:hypothetical protein
MLRRVGKATQYSNPSTRTAESVPTIHGVLAKVGTAQVRLCPPYDFRSDERFPRIMISAAAVSSSAMQA